MDEIDALPLALQGKMLKAIEEKRVRRVGAVADKPVDIKLTVATHADLNARVADGRFRADLYYRLAVVLLDIPPCGSAETMCWSSPGSFCGTMRRAIG